VIQTTSLRDLRLPILPTKRNSIVFISKLATCSRPCANSRAIGRMASATHEASARTSREVHGEHSHISIQPCRRDWSRLLLWLATGVRERCRLPLPESQISEREQAAEQAARLLTSSPLVDSQASAASRARAASRADRPLAPHPTPNPGSDAQNNPMNYRPWPDPCQSRLISRGEDSAISTETRPAPARHALGRRAGARVGPRPPIPDRIGERLRRHQDNDSLQDLHCTRIW